MYAFQSKDWANCSPKKLDQFTALFPRAGPVTLCDLVVSLSFALHTLLDLLRPDRHRFLAMTDPEYRQSVSTLFLSHPGISLMGEKIYSQDTSMTMFHSSS